MLVTDIIDVTKARSRIFIDGSFAFVLYKGELRKFHIEKDKEIAEADYSELMEKILPEVAADAALLVDPFSVESIADAMEKVLDEEVRNELIEKGRRRREDFSWDKAAEKWWKVIETQRIINSSTC